MSTQTHIVNGQTFSLYPCKYQDSCTKYNPAFTLPVTILGIDGKTKIIDRLNPCNHGGGLSCKGWKYKTDRLIGWHRENNVVQGKGMNTIRAGLALTSQGKNDVLDKSEAVIEKLKNQRLQL